jgi:hypothetical protein
MFDDWFSGILSILIFVVLFIGFLIYDFFDGYDRPRHTVEGIVIGNHYHPAYTTYIMSGKIMIPQYHAAYYSVTFKTSVGELSVHSFKKLSGARSISYRIGRFSDAITWVTLAD